MNQTVMENNLPPHAELGAANGSAPAPLKLIADCLDHGRMAWKIWAEHWRTNAAYGNGQPQIHPAHAKVISDFDAVIETVKKLRWPTVSSASLPSNREKARRPEPAQGS